MIKMKALFTCMALTVSVFHFMCAQSIERSVIGSAGELLSFGGQSLNYTLGESVVGYIAGPTSIDQGFWVGKGILVIPLPVENEENIQIRVYPNPVIDQITIYTGEEEILAMQVFGVNAQRVLHQSVESRQLEQKLDLSHLSKGVYILQLLVKGKNLKEYKIIKN
ncbi:MAG: hypothetical protein CML05_12150 [Pseudozobellia sp.]|nr:hypothetical protein [Pseudozobellia sp.]